MDDQILIIAQHLKKISCAMLKKINYCAALKKSAAQYWKNQYCATLKKISCAILKIS